jgi:hypothetical protein
MYRYRAGVVQVLVQVTGHYYRKRKRKRYYYFPLYPPEGEGE